MTTKAQRGQFFTTNKNVQTVMLSLVANKEGKILEPSAGAGDLLIDLETNPKYIIDAVELDNSFTSNCKTPITYQDFFTYAVGKENTYNVIYGNPPYVSWKALETATKLSAEKVKEDYSDKTNLYHLFIDRCIDLLAPGGEMIFIVPKEWLYTSSATPLRNKILDKGSLTHIIDCGEEKLFVDADVPALLIFRFEKDLRNIQPKFAANLSEALANTYETKTLTNKNGRFLLLDKNLTEETKTWGRVKDSFDVKVGIVSGADNTYRITELDKVDSSNVRKYVTTKGIENFIDLNDIDKEADIPVKTLNYLLPYKNDLMARRIRAFDESNWWKYGAIRNLEAMESNKDRFYALVKTRSTTPFFANSESKYYSGGILGIFKTGNVTTENAIKILNSSVYRQIMESMFLTTGNKVSLQPATLEDAPFPKNNEDAEAFIKKHNL